MWLKTASAKISDVALKTLIQFLTTGIITDWKDLPFPSSLSIPPLPNPCTWPWPRPWRHCQVWLSDKHRILSNFQLLKYPKTFKGKDFPNPSHLFEVHLLVWNTRAQVSGKDQNLSPCWFLCHRREGEKNHQHMDGLDPDLGKVFLWGKTYDWGLSGHSPEGNIEQEQRALHPSNSHRTLLLGKDGNNAENNRPKFSS